MERRGLVERSGLVEWRGLVERDGFGVSGRSGGPSDREADGCWIVGEFRGDAWAALTEVSGNGSALLSPKMNRLAVQRTTGLSPGRQALGT